MDIYLVSKYITIGGFAFILLFLVFFDLEAREFRRLSKVQLLGLALIIFGLAIWARYNQAMGDIIGGAGILLLGIESVKKKK